MNASFREKVADWLESGEIELFIGYEKGSTPLRATPVFVRSPKDVERLIWDATCENNLVTFLTNYPDQKIGIMVKGCDSRAIIGLMQEGQITRDNVRIIGVHCPGVIDPLKVADKLNMPVEDLENAHLKAKEVIVGETELALEKVIYDMCQACDQHNPILFDVEIGDPIPDEQDGDAFSHVREMEALSTDERWTRFTQEMERCNLCYACRNVCPLCYCNICFADSTQPRWFNQTAEAKDAQFFQIMRTFHLAGRCVGCGACTRACPQGINIRILLDKLRKDVYELYDYEAGTDPDAKAPLRTYRQDDGDDFVL